MNKIHNKSTVSSLAILAILALAVITMPATAKADSNSAGYVNAYNRSGITDGGVNSFTASSTSASKPKVASTTSTSKPAVKSNSQTANVVSAQSGSMFSGILGWILIAILILLIVILARKVIGADKKYHAAPMKQA